MNKDLASLNRERLKKQVEKESILVLYSGQAPKKSADATYEFCVNRNFYYVTGIDEPNLIFVLLKGETYLFIEEVDLMYEKWIGKKVSAEEAINLSGIQNIRYVEEFYSWLQENLDDLTVYLDLEEDQFLSSITPAIELSLELEQDYKVVDCFNIFRDLRLIKSTQEIENIKKANVITKEAIYNVLDNLRPGIKESYLEADFDYVLKRHNVGHAFETIVASGKNACTLHYVTNNDVIGEDDLVLFDLGATYDLYCADVSRTFPASGKFTERQKTLYNIVLAAKELVIKNIKPQVTLDALNQLVIDHYAVELKKIGLIQSADEVKKYYYHKVGHPLGLDTHDIGSAEVRSMPLPVGSVITCEPGLYIKEEGIGIRIEDDILVTENGSENLTVGIIETVEEIEAYLKDRK